MDFGSFSAGLGVGFGVGGGLAYILTKARVSTSLLLKEAEAARLSSDILESKSLISALETELRAIERNTATLQARNGLLETELKSWHAESEKKFEHLALTIAQRNSEHLQKSSEKSLGQLLEPFKERLKEFQKKVEDTYQSESRERFALKTEIERIVKAGEVMSLETHNLTRALKGDVKVQGNWGEIVLERILEASGLRAGEEYIVQGAGMSLRSDEGAILRPDVIIKLPDSKHLIVDSKVSLVHYDRVASSETKEERLIAAKGFMASLDAHVEGLSAKRYQDLSGLGSPDFVMMFVPIEGAFALALQEDPSLFSRAWDKHVMFVSPTTLLATLRTVASVWKQERQTRNAIEIARVGGGLYEKFAGFVDDLKQIDGKLGDARDSLDRAMSKLSQGKGNLVSRVEQLKKLGAKTAKNIALEASDSMDADESRDESALAALEAKVKPGETISFLD